MIIIVFWIWIYMGFWMIIRHYERKIRGQLLSVRRQLKKMPVMKLIDAYQNPNYVHIRGMIEKELRLRGVDPKIFKHEFD